MRLWAISDLHMEKRPASPISARPEFDVLVCAGDMSDKIGLSLEFVAALAAGKPAVFVAGNHEYWSGDPIERGRVLAAQHGVHFLERNRIEIAGVRFAGATLWEPSNSRFVSSVAALAASKADVVVTHYPPPPGVFHAVDAPLWICGHLHGHGDFSIGGRRLVRNACGYPGEVLVGPAGSSACFDPLFVVLTDPWSADGRGGGQQK